MKGKLTQLLLWLNENDIKVAALQETKLHKNSKIGDTPNFTLIREDRVKDSGGGLAFLVHSSLPFQKLDSITNDPHIEHLAIKIENLTITNLYIPPTSSCNTPGYQSSISPYLPVGEALVLGDLNAHDALWHSQLQDARGTAIAEEIGDSNLATINEDTHTRLPPNENGLPSSPDVSLASLSLLPYASWESHSELGSDHLPLTITLATDITTIPSEKKTFLNFRKANWAKFYMETEEQFAKLEPPPDVYKGEKTFRLIINKISRASIPAGRIKETFQEVPTATAEKIRRRDALRKTDPISPQLAVLNSEIDKEIRKHREDKWREKVGELDRRQNSSKLFKLIKALNGGNPRASNNQAIRFKGKYLSNPSSISNAFNKQFSSVTNHKSSKSARTTTKILKKKSLENATTFTPEQTKAAIKKSKPSKALGPDKISTLHLKHLGPHGIEYLTKIFNLSITTSTIPAIWKSSIVVPLLKPNKPAEESTSFRPVSLLCPPIKVLERLILPDLQEHLPVPEFQHGFRGQHSTVTALNDFNQAISAGFNKRKPPDRTLLLQIDLSKAFDMVSHEKLLKDLEKTSLPDHIKRWMNCYIHGRQARVNFRNHTSRARNVRTGVPQGAVTSPILFNFYLNNIPTPPAGVKLIQYADDISVYTSGRSLDTMCNLINQYIDRLVDFLTERDLLVSPEKSTVTYFTPDTKEANITPNITIKGKSVKLEKKPKLLGVVYDTMFTFSHHVKDVVRKGKAKVNVLKALAGSNWGQDKECLLMTYKAVARSTLEYACPVWSPMISDTNWSHLQTVQNQALRTATGCLAMSNVDHLHQESQVLPLRQHGQMLTKQFLAGCAQSDHPGHKHMDNPAPQRNLKKTLYEHKAEISTHYEAGLNFKQVLKKIHTETVQECISTYAPNKALQSRPPEINKDETNLPRNVRVELARLRSGYSRKLNSYLHKIDEQTVDECPSCAATPHDVKHIFNCPDNPTDLTVRDLWSNPRAVATFLSLDDDDEV